MDSELKVHLDASVKCKAAEATTNQWSNTGSGVQNIYDWK